MKNLFIKKKVIILMICFLAMLLGLNLVNSLRISKRTYNLIINVYESEGDYDNNKTNLSEHDFNVIAAESIGGLKTNDTVWDYDIGYVHTISFGISAYSYVNDTCVIYSSDGKRIAGYRGRHLRIHWILKNGNYEVDDVVEYITPEIIPRLFDMFS